MQARLNVRIGLLVLAIASSAARVCERGGYCSLNAVKGYVGPLDTASQLKDALAATAFNREIIVTAESRVPVVAQTLSRFRAAGYAHVLVVMEETWHCHHLKSVFTPWILEDGPISCGHYALEDESGNRYPSGFKYLAQMVGFTAWWRKWFTVGRAVALGYNVMAIDSDVLVIDDWYWRVKQPPLSQFNMLTQNEWGINFNGGFSYIQNAASNGPVAWILFEALHRTARLAEDSSVLAAGSEKFRKDPALPIDDQGMLQECVFSAAAGRPVFPSLLALYRDDKAAYEAMGMTADKIHTAIHTLVFEAWNQGQAYPVEGELAQAVCEYYTKPDCSTDKSGQVVIPTVKLQMPHSGGRWPSEFGGYPFNRELGNITKAYRQAYADLGVLLPPNPEDPGLEAEAKATKPERFGYLTTRRDDAHCHGCWAESSWWMVGRHGWWHRDLAPSSRRTGIGHIWANLFLGMYNKEAILIATGHFDWKVAARVTKSKQRVYKANQPCNIDPTQHHNVPEIRTVVAYSPGVIHSNLTKDQYVEAVQALAQVAVALGAIAAWPDVPCDSDWVLTPEGRNMPRPIQHTVPWSHLDTYYQVVPFGTSLDRLKCEWSAFAHLDCLCNAHPEGSDVGRGMMAMEFDHLRTTSEAVPTPKTTLVLQEANSPAPPAGNTKRTPVSYKTLVRLNAPSIFVRQQRETMPVFWLDRLVEVQELQGEAADVYARWRIKCFALGYPDKPKEQKERV